MTGLMLFWWQAHSSKKPPSPPEGRAVRMGRETTRNTVQTDGRSSRPGWARRRPLPHLNGGPQHYDVGGHTTTGSCQHTAAHCTTRRGPSPALEHAPARGPTQQSTAATDDPPQQQPHTQPFHTATNQPAVATPEALPQQPSHELPAAASTATQRARDAFGCYPPPYNPDTDPWNTDATAATAPPTPQQPTWGHPQLTPATQQHHQAATTGSWHCRYYHALLATAGLDPAAAAAATRAIMDAGGPIAWEIQSLTCTYQCQ